MKHSIEKIFKNLNLFLLIILALASLSFLFIVEQYYSYEKVSKLQKQVSLVQNILQGQKESKELDIIAFNASIAEINNDIKNLIKQSQYNYISLYVLKNTVEYLDDLDKFNILIQNFNKLSRENLQYKENKAKKSRLPYLVTTVASIERLVHSMIMKNINYDANRFDIFSKLFLLMFILLFVTTFWYKRRLGLIYKDIKFLSSIDADKNTHVFTQEISFIEQRGKRKTQISDNPAMMDPITEIHNNKGMIQAYAQRKLLKENAFSSVTVLEIDNFSKSKRVFSQEFTQKILKKVAYAISLHQQATDIIARSDYNQFTLIFSRLSKEQLFKHTDLVRQSISEIKLISPDKEAIKITVTGGFTNKTNNAPLDESIRKAKELLQSAKELGKNKIIQLKDIPK